MITFQKMAKYITAEPFRPFRIQMAGGRTFEIDHPDMVQVGITTMTIFTCMSDDPKEAQEHHVEVSIHLTELIEPLGTTIQAQGA
jgi:hypothetical protein